MDTDCMDFIMKDVMSWSPGTLVEPLPSSESNIDPDQILNTLQNIQIGTEVSLASPLPLPENMDEFIDEWLIKSEKPTAITHEKHPEIGNKNSMNDARKELLSCVHGKDQKELLSCVHGKYQNREETDIEKVDECGTYVMKLTEIKDMPEVIDHVQQYIVKRGEKWPQNITETKDLQDHHSVTTKPSKRKALEILDLTKSDEDETPPKLTGRKRTKITINSENEVSGYNKGEILPNEGNSKTANPNQEEPNSDLRNLQNILLQSGKTESNIIEIVPDGLGPDDLPSHLDGQGLPNHQKGLLSDPDGLANAEKQEKKNSEKKDEINENFIDHDFSRYYEPISPPDVNSNSSTKDSPLTNQSDDIQWWKRILNQLTKAEKLNILLNNYDSLDSNDQQKLNAYIVDELTVVNEQSVNTPPEWRG